MITAVSRIATFAPLRALACLLLSACVLLRPAAAEAASKLSAVNVNRSGYYIEIELAFDTRPKALTESYRYDPDRYLLTIEGCGSSLTPQRIEELGNINHHLLTRVSVFAANGNLSLGFYLNQYNRPFIRYDGNSWFLRFPTASRSEQVTQLADGISLSQKNSTYRNQNFTLYLVRIDPALGVDIFSASADRYDGKTRKRAPSSFARREGAEVVINGGFFGRAGEHLSTLVEDGLIRATGVYPTRPMLIVSEGGQVAIGRYNIETALVGPKAKIPISAKNYPYVSGKVMVYDSRYPLDSLPQSGIYYFMLEGGAMRYVDTKTSGITLGSGQLLVASDIMPEVNPLRNIRKGDDVKLQTVITDKSGNVIPARSAIGGAPMLVEGGKVYISSAEDSVQADIAKSERSRTAVGLTPSGQLLIAVVKEVESQGFGGVTLEALAQIMIDEGAVVAMNLDGGGSSAMVVAGQLMNIAESNERPVSNVLIVKSREVIKSTTAEKGGSGLPVPAVVK
ncbi:phosphodiester glycosidase family protein [bacterium]|nr:phosphodiester glycosidase family protein [bacterium]